jgi:hypothetical protein
MIPSRGPSPGTVAYKAMAGGSYRHQGALEETPSPRGWSSRDWTLRRAPDRRQIGKA